MIADTSASGIQVADGAATREVAHVETHAGSVASQGNPQHELCVALVIHKAQGATVDASLVLVTDGVHLEAAYTALSRGRNENHLYAALDPADSSLEERLEQSAARTMAIEMEERRREAELDHGIEL